MLPAEPSRRIVAVDAIRGFALLGILTMNITLGLPGPARLVPTVSGGCDGWNFVVWVAGYLLFDEKMITLFSMLFGAGILLLSERSPNPGRMFIRRQGILLIMGLLHAYLIWDGDILVPYALCGLLVYPLRHSNPKRLVAIAFLIWLPSLAFSTFLGTVIESAARAERRVEVARSEGRVPSPADLHEAVTWREFHPTPADLDQVVRENLRQSWWQLTIRRMPETFSFQITVFFSSLLWTVSARMLIGMALFKLFIRDGPRAPRFYVARAAAAYSIGLPIVVCAMLTLLNHGFDPAFLFRFGFAVNQLGSLFVAIGHASVLLWLHTSGACSAAFALLASVGRTALSNYLSQSLIATTFFYGYGFAQFGLWDRVHLAYLVLAIWVVQLVMSHVWLKYFQFGPAEWCWRSLSYSRVQPFRKISRTQDA